MNEDRGLDTRFEDRDDALNATREMDPIGEAEWGLEWDEFCETCEEHIDFCRGHGIY